MTIGNVYQIVSKYLREITCPKNRLSNLRKEYLYLRFGSMKRSELRLRKTPSSSKWRKIPKSSSSMSFCKWLWWGWKLNGLFLYRAFFSLSALFHESSDDLRAFLASALVGRLWIFPKWGCGHTKCRLVSFRVYPFVIDQVDWLRWWIWRKKVFKVAKWVKSIKVANESFVLLEPNLIYEIS